MAHNLMLVEDHAIVRNGIRQIFASCADINVAVEASTGQEALDLVRAHAIDVVLLDLSLPDRSGIDVLRHIRREKTTLPVLVLSMHSEEQYAIRVLKAGANGYLEKNSATEEILRAVRSVLSGKQYISHSIAQQIAGGSEHGHIAASHERLSTREFEVFRMLAQGRSVRAIGIELFLSPKTVSSHRSSVLKKMRFRSNADLTYYAIKNQLID